MKLNEQNINNKWINFLTILAINAVLHRMPMYQFSSRSSHPILDLLCSILYGKY